jgi:hypothetical protein
LGKSRRERERCKELDSIGRLLLWLISATVVEVQKMVLNGLMLRLKGALKIYTVTNPVFCV